MVDVDMDLISALIEKEYIKEREGKTTIVKPNASLTQSLRTYN